MLYVWTGKLIFAERQINPRWTTNVFCENTVSLSCMHYVVSATMHVRIGTLKLRNYCVQGLNIIYRLHIRCIREICSGFWENVSLRLFGKLIITFFIKSVFVNKIKIVILYDWRDYKWYKNLWFTEWGELRST